MGNLSDDIIKYKKGELSAEQMHTLEKKALYDPFLAEALEGMESISEDEFTEDVSSINESIRNKKKTIQFTPLRIAAGIILISASVFIIYQFTPKAETLALKSEKQKPEIKNEEKTMERADDSKSAAEGKTESQKLKPKSTEESAKRDEPLISNNQVPIAQQAQPKNLNSETEIKHAIEQAQVQGLASAEDHPAKIDNADDQNLKEISSATQKLSGAGSISNGDKKDSFAKREVQQFAAPLARKKAVKSAADQKVIEEVSSLPESKKDARENDEVSQLSEIVVTGIDLPKDKTHEPVIHLAEPVGGNPAYDNYLQSNLKYPEEALKNKINGRSGIEFTIGIDGNLSNFKVIKKLGYGCDEELIRLVKAGPKWTPSTEDLKPIESKAQVLLIFDPENKGK